MRPALEPTQEDGIVVVVRRSFDLDTPALVTVHAKDQEHMHRDVAPLMSLLGMLAGCVLVKVNVWRFAKREEKDERQGYCCQLQLKGYISTVRLAAHCGPA